MFGKKPRSVFIKVFKTKQLILHDLKKFELDLCCCIIQPLANSIDHSKKANFKVSKELLNIFWPR